MLPATIAAALNALILSVRFSRDLNIRRAEWGRYFKKSVSFGLCYAGLGAKKTLREGWRAGEAAFLCCAYDVVTDWRKFDAQSRMVFEKILRRRVSRSEFDLAMDLYEKEHLSLLTDEGLERGPIALRFTLQVMRCEGKQERAWGDLNHVGRLLQIVDDVLDLEQDLARGEMNCLISEKRKTYLEELLLHLSALNVRRLFGSDSSILTFIIGQARKKAEVLLAESVPVCKIMAVSHDA
jgi:hypothetical protein